MNFTISIAICGPKHLKYFSERFRGAYISAKERKVYIILTLLLFKYTFICKYLYNSRENVEFNKHEFRYTKLLKTYSKVAPT